MTELVEVYAKARLMWRRLPALLDDGEAAAGLDQVPLMLDTIKPASRRAICLYHNKNGLLPSICDHPNGGRAVL